MKTKSLLAKGLALSMLLGASAAFGQYGTSDLSDTPAVGAQIMVNNIIRSVQLGDQLEINGQLVTVTEDLLIPRNANVSVDGQAAKVLERPGSLTLGIYPGTGWFLGGAIPVDEFGTVEGGTKFVWGSVISASYRLPIKAPLTFTGWYYLPMDNDSKDLYQLGLQYMLSDSLGFQVGYLDSSEAEVDSATFQLVFKLRSGACSKGENPWELSMLTGIYLNWADFITSTPGGQFTEGNQDFRRKRTSTGFSLALQGGMQLSKTYSLLGSYWFVNDRNLSVSRLGVGVGIKF